MLKMGSVPPTEGFSKQKSEVILQESGDAIFKNSYIPILSRTIGDINYQQHSDDNTIHQKWFNYSNVYCKTKAIKGQKLQLTSSQNSNESTFCSHHHHHHRTGTTIHRHHVRWRFCRHGRSHMQTPPPRSRSHNENYPFKNLIRSTTMIG